MKKECRLIPTNLLPKNCFLSDTVTAKDLHTEYKEKQYFELQRKTVPNGIVEELTQVPYSITPETVKSYADSADYHVDPVGAVMRGGQKKNLGDVSAIQKVMNMDSQEAAAFYRALKQRIEGAQKSAPESAPTPASGSAPTPAPEGGDV